MVSTWTLLKAQLEARREGAALQDGSMCVYVIVCAYQGLLNVHATGEIEP